MKKLLIATAALAMVAGTAQAQSSVTVYGVIDTGYNSLENNIAGTKTTVDAVAGGQLSANGEAASSRFGLRGTEDLGGGRKANFVIETAIGTQNSTSAGSGNGATNIGDRAFWAGLEDSKMGQLRVGRQDTFTRSVWLGHDQLAFANVVGNLAHSTELAGAATATGGGATTSAHVPRNVAINYLSPRFNGVQVSLGLTKNDSETTTTAKTGSGSQVGLSYVQGKLSIAAAYVEATTSTNRVAAVDAVVAATSSNTVNGVLGSAAVAASNVKTKDTGVAASYNLGFATVAYIYNKKEAVNSLDLGTTSNLARESNAFSVSVPVGAKTVLRAGYGFGEYQQGATSTYKGDTKGMQAAVNYNLSKRTMAYVIYGDEKRETSSTASIKAKEYSVGVRHSF